MEQDRTQNFEIHLLSASDLGLQATSEPLGLPAEAAGRCECLDSRNCSSTLISI